MTDKTGKTDMAGKPDMASVDAVVFEDLFRQQGEAMRAMFAPLMPAGTAAVAAPDPADLQHWAMSAAKLQKMWLDYSAEQSGHFEPMLARFGDIGKWTETFMSMAGQLPIAQAETQARLWSEGMALWTSVLGQFTPGTATPTAPALPRTDRRFADKRWHEQPAFALIHQTYLLLSEKLQHMADEAQGLSPERKEQLRFATKMLTDALSPANFPLTNPIVIERTMETKGENLVKGAEHLIEDLRKGQLTHTDPLAFELGRNIAVTPGKVIHETPLFQLIQYTPTTDEVFSTPLLIFPPWINRFYILDLNPQKSFIRWAVAQGLTVFVVSWKSADAAMADVVWDDYIRSQIEAIDHVRDRLKVPAVHTIGYCVAGTTLAATLAILARRGQADKVASATFFTAQVDFDDAGELRNFIDDRQLKMLDQLSTDGYLDGRIMAATFNALRGSDLIWNYVVNNYLLGQDYPAFDLLHWNGDTTNLPSKWHKAYLCDLYRDNRLVIPDALEADGTPIDLRRIAVPCYIQAGREDHIAPANSVWKLTRHLSGSWRFVLAGSGHIAGVVNPPEAGKYQYWLNPDDPATLEEFVSGATETKGSWWPDWAKWIAALAPARVASKGKRVPGGKGNRVIEDAPGRYVRSR
ncbi:polyhydroxyalkanoate synthase [Novosphingobium hassiacum]|uniref:Polyhydroxyalkanoate synthase n=1 Tax=Novosphingobium hassiacum TaxID=173676 RepID=A0A7W6A0D1_9SPHN|nr:class I poly(R)-hydroxyalkanoic acid synthase [Novosphingobium hassiacum]MBB3862257.1 polyhydroxyalkanoate synthase [Novosphingobium hassiacum]